MTDFEKQQITALRQQGLGYRAIARKTLCSLSAVKSFCQRRKLIAKKELDDINHCKQCGAPITQAKGRRLKKFCSAKCRMQWWREHRKAIVHHKLQVCQHCGKSFFADRRGRKYCCVSCYMAERFGCTHAK